MPVSDWSTSADDNITVGGISIAEHCPAANINDAMREIMAEVKETLYSKETARLVVAGSPGWYRRPSLFSSAKTSVTIPADTQVCINGDGYISQSATTLQLSTVGAASALAGKDVYIYACQPTGGSSPVFVLSLNSTVPSGYDANSSRKIGGFHCLCSSVGTISGHHLSGYVTGDIIPYTRWDLLHRPVSEPEGMSYIEPMGKWVQIYLPSWDGSKLVSRYGGTIVDGASSFKLDGEGFAYYAGLSGCSLIRRDEFVLAARGSNEGTNIANSADPGTTGGHNDTGGRRMVSNYGLEDCCGVIWQWSADTAENVPGSTWNSNNFYLDGYSWQEKSVYNSSFDSTRRGSCCGLLRRFRVGANWGDRSNCGSRSVNCNNFSSDSWTNNSGRLASDTSGICLSRRLDPSPCVGNGAKYETG